MRSWGRWVGGIQGGRRIAAGSKVTSPLKSLYGRSCSPTWVFRFAVLRSRRRIRSKPNRTARHNPFQASSHHGRHHAPVRTSTTSDMPKQRKVIPAIATRARCSLGRIIAKSRKPRPMTAHNAASMQLAVSNMSASCHLCHTGAAALAPPGSGFRSRRETSILQRHNTHRATSGRSDNYSASLPICVTAAPSEARA